MNQFSKILPLLFLVMGGYLGLTATCKIAPVPEESVGDLQFSELPGRWDEGLPLGNGMVGSLIWENGDRLRFSLDRADLWDLREVQELKEMTYNWVHRKVVQNDYEPVHKLGDEPYNKYPYPTKIQAAGLEFTTGEWGDIEHARLWVKSAIAEVKWEKGQVLRSFVHAEEPVGWFRFEGVPEDFTPILDIPPYSDESDSSEGGSQQLHRLSDLGYEQGDVNRQDNSITYTQPGANGMSYQVAVKWENDANSCVGAWSITSEYPNEEPTDRAAELARRALSAGFDNWKVSHVKWWQQFWSKSNLHVPDTLLQRQWEREMYKFGAAARPGAPPISLQAVWTADNGSLPPWKGDYHHDLNTELSYWPGYSGNHLELTRSFTDWLWKIRDENKRYTRWYFEADGLNVPGVCTLTGQPMGGWIQYAMSPTVSAWLAQHFYWQWSYSQDEQFLRERAYPYIHDVAVYLEDVTRMENGIRTLPLSSSPEMHNNSLEAWFQKTTNYDLALMKNTFDMAAELADKLGKTDEQQRWEKRLIELPDLAVSDDAGLLVAPGEPLEESHRHFSHLLAIHPLGMLDPADGEEEKELIIKSLNHLEQVGTDNWVGYSFSWLANLYARAGKGDKAAEALRIFASHFISPNSFHLNGDQSGGQYTNYAGRPFTLEGNYAFAAGLQEMLMQSNTGVIEIFPAVPDQWREVSFENFRARGAFLVSAERRQGQIQTVTIHSEVGGRLRLAQPFVENKVQIMSKSPNAGQFSEVKGEWKGDILEIPTRAGQIIKLSYANH